MDSPSLSWTSIRYLLLTALLGAYLPTAAAAAAGDSCQVDARCSAHADKGNRSFRTHDYAEALREFQLAYGIQPEPRLQINIGRCLHRLGRPSEAMAAYQQFQTAQPDPDAESKALLDRYISESQASLEATANPTANPTAATNPSVEPETPTVVAGKPPPPIAAPRPIYKSWRFWTAAGGAAGIVALTLGLSIGLTPRPYKDIVWQ